VRRIVLITAVVLACFAGGAIANHPQVDPATVPTGFLTAHSTVNNVPVTSIERALRSGKADVFIEHQRLTANQSAGFVTTPGPAFYVVQKGSATFAESAGGECRTKLLNANQGVTARQRRAHRLTAGAQGAEVYVVYLLPRRTGPHRTAAGTPAGC
jgi:hypothetical protein